MSSVRETTLTATIIEYIENCECGESIDRLPLRSTHVACAGYCKCGKLNTPIVQTEIKKDSVLIWVFYGSMKEKAHSLRVNLDLIKE